MSTNSPPDSDTAHGPTFAVARSRGAFTGILLIALGAWGVMLPLIGPRFHFGYGPDTKTFDVTPPRFWLQILPGAVVALAGLFILVGGNRITGSFFAYAAAAAGAWYVVGPILADLRTKGYVAAPLGSSDRHHLDAIAAFYGLGAVIVFLAALTAGRMSIVGVRDIQASEKRHRQTERAGEALPGGQPPAYPATRPVSVTTTNVRPAQPADLIESEPADQSDADLNLGQIS